MSNNKRLYLVDEMQQVQEWYNSYQNTEKKETKNIINEVKKIKSMSSKEDSERRIIRKIIRKLAKLHDAALALDSELQGFSTIGEYTTFIEQTQFKTFSLSRIPVDIRKKSIEDLLDNNALYTNKNRKEQFLSYALLKIEETKNLEAYDKLKYIVSKEKLDPHFYLKHLAKRAEFGAKLIKSDPIMFKEKIKLPSLQIVRFMEAQKYKN